MSDTTVSVSRSESDAGLRGAGSRGVCDPDVRAGAANLVVEPGRVELDPVELDAVGAELMRAAAVFGAASRDLQAGDLGRCAAASGCGDALAEVIESLAARFDRRSAEATAISEAMRAARTELERRDGEAGRHLYRHPSPPTYDDRRPGLGSGAGCGDGPAIP